MGVCNDWRSFKAALSREIHDGLHISVKRLEILLECIERCVRLFRIHLCGGIREVERALGIVMIFRPRAYDIGIFEAYQ
jgi:hypothetical protein